MLILYTASCEIFRLQISTGNCAEDLANTLTNIHDSDCSSYRCSNLPRPNYPPSPGPRPRPGPVYPPPDVPTPPDSPRYRCRNTTTTLIRERLRRQSRPGILMGYPDGPLTRPDPPTPPPYPNPGPINPPPDVPTPPEYHRIFKPVPNEQSY
jgi:hypothetical protein